MMKLAPLRAFVAIMRTGSVTAAADSLGMSQPAVSRMLAGLEDEIGFRLFFREHGRLTPTNEGRRFLEKCEAALSDIDGLKQAAKEIAAYRDGILTILCTPQSGYTIFPNVVSRLYAKYPNVKLNLLVVNRNNVGDAILRSHYDIGFSALPVEHRNVKVRSIITLPALAVLPATMPVPDRRNLKAEDFQGRDFITLTSDNLIRQQVDMYFILNEIRVRSMIETSSPLIAYNLASQGLGMSIIDPFTPIFIASNKVTLRELDADIHLTYGFFAPDNRPLSKLAEDAISTFQSVIEEYYPVES